MDICSDEPIVLEDDQSDTELDMSDDGDRNLEALALDANGHISIPAAAKPVASGPG